MTTPISANPNEFPEFTYTVVNGEPVLTLLSYELELTIDDLEKVIAAHRRELHRMRAFRDQLCRQVPR